MSSFWNDLGSNFNRESMENSNVKGLSSEEAKQFYNNPEYETYFVEYVGDFAERISTVDYAEVYPLRYFFAVIFVKNGMINVLLQEFPEIINIERSFPYTLFNLSKTNENPDLSAMNKGNTTLNGEGVIVGIVGTGIDYLNPRFQDENGNTRILSIWDQSLSDGGASSEDFMFGGEFDRNQINQAIAAKSKGNNPYEIVNHKDDIGYSTAIANIIGGRSLLETEEFESIAPKCEFVIIKLRGGSKSNLMHWGLENFDGTVFDSNDVFTSISYCYKIVQKFNKPLVMFLPVGTNLGAHNGDTISEKFIDFFSEIRKFSVVTSTGDQGGSAICSKNSFSENELEKIIYLNVDDNQKNIFFSINYFSPDVLDVSITNPKGETTNKINIRPNDGEEISVKLGESTIDVQYFLEGKTTVNQRLDFVIKNAVGGVWNIGITKVEAIYGYFNIWLQQWQFSQVRTGLLNPSQDTTLMTPATANSIIVTSSFNQIENRLLEEAGRGFSINNTITPIIATAGKNILTIGANNENIVVSGAAVSGAILTGVVALLYQWGIVDKNDINMYSSKLKSYLIQGTIREEDKNYPNEAEGFGLLSLEKLFKKLESKSKNNSNKRDTRTEKIKCKKKSNMYVNIPKDFFKS